MTISTTAARADYLGNGTTTDFAIPFKFFANADLLVYSLVTATGVETLLTLTTHYTVTGAGTPSGGTLTMLTAPAIGSTLSIQRDVQRVQGSDYVDYDPLPAETLETNLDKLTAMAQDIAAAQDRMVRERRSEPTTGLELPARIDRAGKLAGYDAAGDLTHYDIPEVPENTSQVFWCGTASGTANAITLTAAPAPTAYADGQLYFFVAALTNTAGVVVNANSLGNVTLLDPSGSALGAGAIIAGRLYGMTGRTSGAFRLVASSSSGRDVPYLTATGSGTYPTAFTASTTTTPATNEIFLVSFGAVPDVSATLAINGGTAREIRRHDGGVISRGLVRDGVIYPCVLVSSLYRLLTVNHTLSLANSIEFKAGGALTARFINWREEADAFHRVRVSFGSTGVDLVAGGTGASNDAVVVARAQSDGDFRGYNRVLTGTPPQEVYHPANPPAIPWEDIGEHLLTVRGPQNANTQEAVVLDDAADPMPVCAFNQGTHLRVTVAGGWIDASGCRVNTSEYTVDLQVSGTHYFWSGMAAIWRETNDALAKSNTEFTSVVSDSVASTFTFAGGNPVTEGLGIGDVIEFANLAATANNGVQYTILNLSGGSNRTVTVAPPPVTDAVADAAFTVTRRGSRTLAITGPAFCRLWKGQADIGLEKVTVQSTRASVVVPTYGEISVGFGQSWWERLYSYGGHAGWRKTRQAWKDGDPDPALNTSVYLISAAAGASALLPNAATVSTNYWWDEPTGLPGPNLWNAADDWDPATFIGKVKRAMAAGFTPSTATCCYGLNDMNSAVWAATGGNTPAKWTASQLAMQAWIRTKLGLPGLKFLITPVPSRRVGTFTQEGYNAMRQAQLDVIAADPTGTFRGPPAYSVIRIEDDEHHGYYAMDQLGQWMPRFTANALGTRTEETGPKIVSFTEVSGTEYEIEIEPTTNTMVGREAVPNFIALWHPGAAVAGDPYGLFGAEATYKAEIKRYVWGTSGANHLLTINTTTSQTGRKLIYPYGSCPDAQAPSNTIRDGVTFIPLLEHRIGDYVT